MHYQLAWIRDGEVVQSSIGSGTKEDFEKMKSEYEKKYPDFSFEVREQTEDQRSFIHYMMNDFFGENIAESKISLLN